MATLFTSDVHLNEADPEITALFKQFLSGVARGADALYILGDLFESWVGDDDDRPLVLDIQQALRDYTATGVPTYFMRGNRDFLIGEGFALRTGITLLEDPTIIDLNGMAVLLMHGDTLCTDDVAYQAFRRLTRDPEWQAQFLSQPLGARRAYAERARQESKKHTSTMVSQIMDVNVQAVLDAFEKSKAQRMIHGHTHRPAIHRHEADTFVCYRTVLTDWHTVAGTYWLQE